jgi:hypothetical protein
VRSKESSWQPASGGALSSVQGAEAAGVRAAGILELLSGVILDRARACEPAARVHQPAADAPVIVLLVDEAAAAGRAAGASREEGGCAAAADVVPVPGRARGAGRRGLRWWWRS